MEMQPAGRSEEDEDEDERRKRAGPNIGAAVEDVGLSNGAAGNRFEGVSNVEPDLPLGVAGIG